MKKIISIASIVILLFLLMIIKEKKLDYYFISYGNYENEALIVKEKTNETKIIKKYKNYDYIKIDKIINEKKVSYDELCDIIKTSDINKFEYGIVLNNGKISILKEELIINKIIDYSSNEINFKNLNTFLAKKGYAYNINAIDDISILETVSLFYNKEEKRFEPIENNPDLDYIENMSIKRLVSMVNKNGKFIYGYNIYEGNELTSYNILRHAGTLWSMIKYYQKNPNNELKKIINDATEYLIANIKFYDNNIAYVIENKTQEIKLGGNGLALIALSEYLNIFSNDTYYDIAVKLANGILSMQKEDGSFIHVLSLDCTLKEEMRTVFYDGEATFALLKFYEISGDERYLNNSQKAINYFIQENYTIYRDHWISYVMNEYLKFETKDIYISFALNNYSNNKNRFGYNSFGPTRLELLTTVYKTYLYLKEKVPNNEDIINFDVNHLIEVINKEFNNLLTYYISDNISIYYKNSDNIKGGFYDLNNNYRMRIDDIQHSLLGIMNYQEIEKDI